MVIEISQTRKDKYCMISLIWNLIQNEQEKLIEKEVRFVVTRGGDWGQAEMEESGQKVQTYNYSLSKHWGFNIVTQ